ncbi:putative cytochrome P450 [Nocardia brasiliensis NBRC 14402]|uniref:cytochrome P450 n=1 Tax=Nocardia brasiliensis TaxID=37326 RepID=UPI0002E1EDB6|nr:cytochrome P450 [Nocardia brasiliensis]ASF09304.1 cytochrome P450 [Nocardia brasiliensis]GAJ81658.1 putative cytochrome P450 [Nocardia brasiliensis NBRC 14402]SUB40010.1 Cytochrome P450-SU2 [Nocardia brasiliensis]
MTELTTVFAIPTDRPAGCPFDPPAELGALRARNPLTRMVFPGGHHGWLATGYATVRAILADPRFSARAELTHSPSVDLGPLPPAPPGDFLNLDAPEHTRYRKLLAGKFTVRRMRLLTAHVAQVSAEYLDAMETSGGPLDLLTAFAYPIPALVICELLGVPDGDRPRFQQLVADLVTKMNDPNIPLEQGLAVFEEARHCMRRLVADKRNAPTDDLLSELTATDLDEDELTGVAVLLLIGGFDTTANMLALGTFALLRHPEQSAALRADPGLADRAVEELMRYLTLAHTLTRSALADVEVDGQMIKAGETVALSAHAANRDPARFPDPDTLDLRRNATGHLGFGHGVHQCLGQQLARVELRTALPALLSRFPTLRLAVPPNEVPLRPAGLGTYGVQQLPVTW